MPGTTRRRRPATCCCRPSRAWSGRCSSSTTDWRFRYINPAGARGARPDGRGAGRPGDLGGVPRGGRQPVRGAVPRGPGDRAAGQHRGLVRAAARSGSGPTRSSPTPGWWSPTTTSPQRRRTEDERAAAVAAREAAAAAARAAAEAEAAGRHLMLLGDINLAMTSTLDTDEAVDRFAHLVVPLLGRLVPGQRRRPRRHPAGRRPGAPRPGDGRGDAPLRRPAGGAPTGRRAPVPTAAAQPAGR